MKTKTIIPGVTLRKWESGQKSLRFAAMIRGRRFSTTCDLPVDLMVDPRTGRPTPELRAEYHRWVDECARCSGQTNARTIRVPTIGELIELYEVLARERAANPNFRKPTETTINNVIWRAKISAQDLGLTMSRPYNELCCQESMKKLFAIYSKNCAGTTAWLYIMRLKQLTARWFRLKCAERGFVVETHDMPDVGNASRPPEYRMLTAEQKAKIEAWYVSLADHEDPEMFLAASIVAQLAVRPCDVIMLKAENFVRYPDDEFVHLVYTPRKTRESSNRRVDWPIRPALWQQIEAVAGERLARGETMIKQRQIFDKLNRAMRPACGMESWNKAVYELRKLCIDTVRREQGVDAAVALSGDRRETIDRYCSDPYKMVGIKPLEILPIPAIALKK